MNFKLFGTGTRGLGFARDFVLCASGRHTAPRLQGGSPGGRLLQLDRLLRRRERRLRLGHLGLVGGARQPTTSPRAGWSAARSATTTRSARSSGASRATSTGRTSRAPSPARRRVTCEHREHLACHVPRPGRLRLRPLAALHHRRRRLRQRQGDRQRAARWLRGFVVAATNSAGPSASVLNTPSSATGAPRSNISTSISAASTPAPAPLVNNVSFKENIVRAGLNYKFSGPIFSRY